jgi:hypothetical protein
MYACSETRFLTDITNHKMTIIRNDDSNRHLKFANPKSFSYWFDIITWPGCLCINGDCGTFVFSRVEDMFTFFRTSQNYLKNHPEIKLHINPQYWSEKVTSESKFGGIEKFSEKKFRAAVKDYFNLSFENSKDDTEKNECWQQIEDEILYDCSEKETAFAAIYNFNYNKFYFQDFFEYNFNEYTFHFIWCLYAIVWGISQFDKSMPPGVTKNGK